MLMIWPAGLKTYSVPASARPIRQGPFPISVSITEMGSPEYRLATLQQSTAGLMCPILPFSTAPTRYSLAGLLLPLGLNPPCLRRLRTFNLTSLWGGSGDSVPGENQFSRSDKVFISPSGFGQIVCSSTESKRGCGSIDTFIRTAYRTYYRSSARWCSTWNTHDVLALDRL